MEFMNPEKNDLAVLWSLTPGSVATASIKALTFSSFIFATISLSDVFFISSSIQIGRAHV